VLAEPRPLVFDENIPAAHRLAIHPDGRTALVGIFGAFGDGRIRVWDLQSGAILRYLEADDRFLTGIAISPDGLRALSVDDDGFAILWDLQTGEQIRQIDNGPGEGGFAGIVFHPDGRSALTATTNWVLKLWDLDSGEVIQSFEGHEEWVNSLAFSPDGEKAYSTSVDGTVRVWNVATGEQLAVYQPFADGFPHSLAVSPDGTQLLVGKDSPDASQFTPYDGVIALLDASTGERLRYLEGHTGPVGGTLAFSPDGRYALSGSLDQTVRLWEVNTGTQLAVFSDHASDIGQVAFSPDGLTGYSTALDGVLRARDLREIIDGE
jgi:WD40 repeat protein